MKNKLEDMQAEIEKKYDKKELKRKRKVEVSGKSVFKLKKIMEDKNRQGDNEKK